MNGAAVVEREVGSSVHPDLAEFDRNFDALYARLFWASGGVVALPGLHEEREAHAAYDAFLGTLALQRQEGTGLVEQDQASLERKTLSSLIEQAAHGNEEAYAALEIDAHTTVIETILKTGNVTRITADWSEDAGLAQYGRSYRDIQANALSRPRPRLLQERVEIEGLNWKRIESCLRSGRLKEYYLVVISMVPNNVTTEASRKEGFFVDTMTAVVQATTQGETGEVITESAFLAGTEPGTPNRHDLDAARALYRDWGVEGAGTMSTTDFLRHVILVPKKAMMPNGVTDIARMLDEQLGPDYFYGVRRSREDYAEFSRQCIERSQRYKDVTAQVIADLLADHERLAKDPAAAVQALYDAAKKYTVYKAVSDKTIDTRVFGTVAAEHIDDLRMRHDWHWSENNQQEFEQALDEAVATAVTTACGGGSGSTASSRESQGAKKGEGTMGSSEGTKQSKESTKPDVIMKCVHCPLCNRKSVDAVIKYIPAKGIKRITCQSCHGHKDYSL